MTYSTFNWICDFVAKLSKLTRRDIIGCRRAKHVVAARHVVAWLIRNVFGVSFVEVAHWLHMLDHTSAMNACWRVDSELRNGGLRADLLIETIGEMAAA